MRIFVAAFVGALIAGVAFAQNDDSPIVFRPSWDAEPQSADIIRHYPPEALRQNLSGIAVLCCTPNADRSVSCAVSSEWPDGQGFGAASVSASRSYRLSALSYNDLHIRDDRPIRISMMWAAPILGPNTVDDLRRRDHETLEACLRPQD